MSESDTARLSIRHPRQVSVCDVLDRVLDRGVMVAGELTLSVADIDLIYLGFCVRLSGMSSMGAEHPADIKFRDIS